MLVVYKHRLVLRSDIKNLLSPERELKHETSRNHLIVILKPPQPQISAKESPCQILKLRNLVVKRCLGPGGGGSKGLDRNQNHVRKSVLETTVYSAGNQDNGAGNATSFLVFGNSQFHFQ